MENTPTHYQAIARKYRPQTFQQVVGQEAIVTTLKNSILFNKVAHAYLFCGSKGTGKTTLARLLAKALCCAQRTAEAEPCNLCASCTEITSSRSLDVLEIDGASNRGIDDVRQIKETVGYAPSSGNYRIYIIDEVHMLTKEAFNALLKVLEEPPPHVKFLFATTEPHKVPPTILSRCQRFDLKRIDPILLQKKLAWIAQDVGATCDPAALELIAHLAEGSLRDAESLLDQVLCYTGSPLTADQVTETLGLSSQTTLFDLDTAFHTHNLAYPLELAASLFSSGKDLGHFVDQLIDHYRLLLTHKLSTAVFSSQHIQERYSRSAELYTQEQCLYILEMLVEAQRDLARTPFKRIHLEMLLLHIVRARYKISLPSLVRRLHALESSLKTQNTSRELSPEKPLEIKPPAPQQAPQIEQPQLPSFEIEPPAPQQAPQIEQPQLPSFEIKPPAPQQAPQIEQPQLPSFEIEPPAPQQAPQAEQPQPHPTSIVEASVPEIATPLCHYDTLIRFAAIELEGVIHSQASYATSKA